jgi:hypothetical protein
MFGGSAMPTAWKAFPATPVTHGPPASQEPRAASLPMAGLSFGRGPAHQIAPFQFWWYAADMVRLGAAMRARSARPQIWLKAQD